MAEKEKLSYVSWLKAPSRAGGIKSRPSSPKKSSGKSESYQTTSPLRDKDEQVANSNFRPLVPHQELGKKSREENNMIDKNREMSIELDSSNESDHTSRDGLKEVEKNRDNRQIHNDKGKSGTSSEKETWTIGGTKQYIKPISKKWKRLARDKGVNVVQTSSLNQSTNDKRGRTCSRLREQ